MPLADQVLALLRAEAGNPQFVTLDKQIDALCRVLDPRLPPYRKLPPAHADGSESGPTARTRRKERLD